MRQFVADSEGDANAPWFRGEGVATLSDRQLRRYVAAADRLLVADLKHSVDEQRKRHVAKRRIIYARAMAAGNYAVALAALKDEAELLGLYPNPADAVLREIQQMREEMANLERDKN